MDTVFDNLEIANQFHWLVHLESFEDPRVSNENPLEIRKKYKELYECFMQNLENYHPEWNENIALQK